MILALKYKLKTMQKYLNRITVQAFLHFYLENLIFFNCNFKFSIEKPLFLQKS
jgi:hypothetical protein